MKKVLFTAILVAVAGLNMASEGDDLTSLSYIAYLERYATVSPASQEETIEAVINMPLVAGDRLDTAREGRMEVVLADGNYLWLDEYTTLSLDAVAFSRESESERTVLFIADGSIAVEMVDHRLGAKPLRVDTRSATAYLIDPGFYRVQALPSGSLRIEVKGGLAEAATVAGGVLVRAGSSAEVGGGEVLRSDQSLTWSDDFALWLEARRMVAAGESAQHVDLRYSRQAAQLDNYGSWIYVDTLNAWAWQPMVGMDWRPYTAGRWYWTPTGYSWISYEPWGWLPYHYGSWHFTAGFGWVWSWGGYWGPAWVNWIWWPGYVGWCPYGYYNSWYWHHYGGYYPPYHRPGHPGGGVGSQPPRSDVVPPRHVSGRLAAVEPGGERALDLSGRARLSAIDGRAWTVVPEENFTSPSLTRYARAGDRVLPGEGDRTGVVMSGPLTTRSPALARESGGIESVFRRIGDASSRDVSPLLARDSSLAPEAARGVGSRTTVADLGRGRISEVPASSRLAVEPRLSAAGSSPFAAAPSRVSQPEQRTRVIEPNLHRPSSPVTPTGSSSRIVGSPTASPLTGSRIGSPSAVAPRSSSGRVGISRPVIVPRTGSAVTGRPPSGSSVGTTGITRRPSVGSSTPRVSAPRPSSPSVRSSSGRVSAPRVSTGSSRSGGSAARARPSSGGSKPSGGSSGAKKR